ncbi:oxysterol-binding protein-related protein 1 [Parasteatoda tepidariorum]|uniref:oxysterol-binding protein-related protein 1 n=1 Tax=Parasteatoda tepidariorum TaxID=114398 RepID=UPI00077FC425|nr:oxysterol-binding protein-related protein 1 [Parasteatoda tepidariorum]XP_042903917.1 oxysterol-binding protein-related protein 1 [Parasteatoda tepidariorum]
MSEDDKSESLRSCKSPEEKLLFASRTGDLPLAVLLLDQFHKNEIDLDINCKGNHDWRPLHLACYFGHDKIVESLIKHGADVNVLNDTGDTPLHKAAYTGREELVLLLLSKNADVFIRNSEGQTSRSICDNDEIIKLLKGAENADIERKNSMLLQAAREGDRDTIENLLKSDNPPDINCVDSLGNSALHCAAYRGKKEVAVLLLQNGINTSLKNLRGQLAIDLALNMQMKQILGVQPVKHFQKTASRFEGLLLRKSRFLGWKDVYTVLEKGVMSFFNSRADSTTGTRRKGYKYLDSAKSQIDNADIAVFTVIFSDNTRQRFCVPYVHNQQVDRQKWIIAITEHVEFSSHYLKQGFSDSDPEDEEDIIPIGTMQDKLQTAQAHLHVFEKGLDSLKSSLEKTNVDHTKSTFYDGILHSTLYTHAGNLIESGRKVSSSLSHCLTVFAQQEEVRMLQLKQEQERSRVLQDALHALAQEHLELEKSIVSPFQSTPNSPHYQDTDCDEFFDAFEGDYPSSVKDKNDDDTISNSDTAVPSETTGYFASFSVSSDSLKNSEPSKWGRLTLPVPQFSRNDFSVWSILKQCIGKELSKITMPIVFNEPISFLQRLAENMEYSDLLEKANNSDSPVERMEYVAAFACASVASNWDRLGKPFNPLLGETYELIRVEENFKFVAEQVSHHPPVTAFQAESSDFIFTGAVHPKLKLWARSVEVKPEGTLVLKLLKHNETYTWSGVTCCVHNIIVGKLWMEQCGVLEITCHTNGLVAELNFKPAGWYSKDLNCVEGFVLDRQKTKHRLIFGKWCSYIKSMDAQYFDDYQRLKEVPNNNNQTATSSKENSGFFSKVQKKRNSSVTLENGDKGENYQNLDDLPTTLLWEVDPRPECSSDYYNFTSYAMALNELTDEMKPKLPPTDSRLRPDIRKLEEGDIDGAAFEKNRLEEKQRETRKQRKKDKTTWTPVLFESKPHPYAKEESWSFKGDYWERNFAQSPDIF